MASCFLVVLVFQQLIDSSNQSTNNTRGPRDDILQILIMKAQSLQDAIKAKARDRQKKFEKGEWKEPVVKQHKVTAADMKAGHGVQSPAAVAAPMAYAAAPPMNNAELTAIKNMTAKLLPKVEEMSKEIKQQRSDISALQKENKELKALMQSQAKTSNQETSELKELIRAQASKKAAQAPLTYPMSPMTPSTSAYSSPTASPRKFKPPASMEPHAVEDLLTAQRKDPALRHFMKTKEGLFEPKHLSVREVEGGSLVLFKKKFYIPERLRSKTIQYYKNEYQTESKALEVLRKNCCWPELEKDFYSESKKVVV